ncbi:hypothetical protein [Luteipulveratus mongoliensis]|uniref:Uncharacterized protein n=1 Tax=Luteipulveratus mongoliensis TaxID=571913 RepID=A0A0K1JH32_9MICO|nr:hypothetical protein [Luteipulveratus mongoliensis]AKU16027.1 hypothetical protein VV02_09435 [Luteipulveratus mongoliensis]
MSTSDAATGAGGAGRRWQLWTAAVVLLVLVVGVATWRLTRDDVHIGDRLDNATFFNDQSEDRMMSVSLPLTALSLQVGVGRTIGPSDDRLTAPDGATFVKVSWSPTTYSGTPPVWPLATVAQRRDPGSALALVAGGQRYPLVTGLTAADQGSSAVVVAKGDGSDVRIEATYAGRTVTSTVRSEPSTASAIKRPSLDANRGCDAAPPDTFLWVSCTVRFHRGLYVPGLGAAPAGQEWLLVHSSSASRKEDRARQYKNHQGAEYLPSGPASFTVSVGSAAPARQVGRDVVSGDRVRLADRAFLVPAGKPVAIRTRYRLPMTLDAERSEWKSAPKTYLIDVGSSGTYTDVE